MDSHEECNGKNQSSTSYEGDLPVDECSRLKDEISLLKDKIAHLQSQLEESENEAIMAAEIGQQLLEQKSSLEALREQERNNLTAKLEDLTQENFNLTAKLESRERLLESHSQYQEDENNKKKQEQEREQMVASYERKIAELKSDMKKDKMAHDEEVSQLNLLIQQNKEVIENLHNNIAEEKAKSKDAANRSSNDGEIEELKMVLEMCHQAKRQVETKLCEMIHDNERKNLESENLRQRMNEVNEELKEKSRQMEDCYQHLEDAKNTINELNLEINNQQMELKSRGHSKKGNSLFGELEDKRVAAERDLAIFKVRYNSMQKAFNNTKHEMVQMRYQILCFLQTRSGDRADRLRIEQLERALSAKNAETAMLSAKLKQLEQYQRDNDPVNKIQEEMESFQGNDSLKHYVNLLLVNAEDSKHKIETLQKELESARFRLIGKDDQLHETERKLYTATNNAEKFRSESLKLKLKLDEMKNKHEEEKQKRVELENLLNELGIVDRSSISVKDLSKTVKEKKILLPKYLQAASTECKEEQKKNEQEIEMANEPLKSEEQARDLSDVDRKRPAKVLTEKELNDKCCRLLMKTLPKELAEEYVKKYQQDKDEMQSFDENSCSWRKKTRVDRDASKPRKVSFKDEVDVHEIGQCDTSMKSKDSSGNVDVKVSQVSANEPNGKKHQQSNVVVVDEQVQDEACKVQ